MTTKDLLMLTGIAITVIGQILFWLGLALRS